MTAAKLRALLPRLGPVRVMGAHDALGARIAVQAGFDAVWASGLELSASLGVPDIGLIGACEQLAAVQAMTLAVDVPVLVDCDTGYGDEHNVAYAVRRFEAAGAAAICIEDKTFPKRNSFLPGEHELVPIAEFQAKLRAAKAAQQGPDFMIIGRVEALVAGAGIDEALQRARAYAAAGADAILIHSKDPTPDSVLAVARAWDSPVPLVAVPTTYATTTASELAAGGYKLVIYANHGLRAAVRAMQTTCAQILAADSSTPVEASIATIREVFALQQVPARLSDVPP